MSQPTTPFRDAVTEAWVRSMQGQVAAARSLYELADMSVEPAFHGGKLNPSLSVLRHNEGEGEGVVISPTVTEDAVPAITLGHPMAEAHDATGFIEPVIDIDRIEQGIDRLIDTIDLGHHARNVRKELPHTLVLSTGRCGTMSLYRLLRDSAVLPYHGYWWHVSHVTRYEMMCAFMSGCYSPWAANHWCETRAAEWLGAIGQSKPFVGLNHWDTIWAPVFAALHPQARFVHLRRDPVEVFRSFRGKDQYNDQQLRPLRYAFVPEFLWRRTEDDEIACIAWYMHFTETFADALSFVVGPERFLRVEAEHLFAGRADVIGELLDFVGARIPEAVEHFEAPVNAKQHKARDVPIDEVGVFRTLLNQVRKAKRL